MQDRIPAARRRIFPSLFRDTAAIPADLRRHVRYPQLLLEEQAAVYGLYHMSDPEVFYNREDLWTVASELGMGDAGEQQTQAMEPDFVLMKLPGEAAAEFVEILPFTPANRNNLIGWIAGRSDGANYGTSIFDDFPKTKLIDGPMQIEARIDQTRSSGGTHPVEPAGIACAAGHAAGDSMRKGAAVRGADLSAGERSPMPELRLVVLALQDRLAYGPTFETAMAALFGGQASSISAVAGTPAPEAGQTTAPSPVSGNAAGRSPLIGGAAQDLADYQRLTAEGKLAEVGQKLEDLKRKLEQLQAGQK